MSDSSNFDKTWLQDSINRAAVVRAYEAIEVMGRALPCKVTAVAGSIVTVAFEVQAPPFQLPQVTIPKAESQWIRVPTQVGDFGIAVPAQTFLGAVDGLGTGVASLALQGNLSTLYFLPIGSSNFSPAPDANKALVQGPAGVVIQTSDGVVVLTLSAAGLVLKIGGIVVWSVSTSGLQTLAGGMNASGDVTAGSISLQTHVHGGVTTGGGDTGAPV